MVHVAGAGTIVVVEPNVERNLSLALGAHHAVSPSEATEVISNLTKVWELTLFMSVRGFSNYSVGC